MFVGYGQFIAFCQPLEQRSSERLNCFSVMNWKGFGRKGPWHNLMCHLGDDLELMMNVNIKVK